MAELEFCKNEAEAKKDEAEAKNTMLVEKIAELEAALESKKAREREGHRRGRPPRREDHYTRLFRKEERGDDSSSGSRGSKRSRTGSPNGARDNLRNPPQLESAFQGGGDRPSHHSRSGYSRGSRGRGRDDPYGRSGYKTYREEYRGQDSRGRHTEAGREGYDGAGNTNSPDPYPYVRSYGESFSDHPAGEHPSNTPPPPPQTPRYNTMYADNPEGMGTRSHRTPHNNWNTYTNNMHAAAADNPGFPDPGEFPYQRLPVEYRSKHYPVDPASLPRKHLTKQPTIELTHKLEKGVSLATWCLEMEREFSSIGLWPFLDGTVTSAHAFFDPA